MKNDPKNISTYDWSKWWRIPRVFLYLFGFFTYFWYFWSFIGLVIGLLYFIAAKDLAWKRNGIILSLSISFVSLTIYLFKGYPPLTFAIWSGLFIILGYTFILLIYEILKRKSRKIQIFYQKLERIWKDWSHYSKQFTKISFILFPIVSWCAVNLDLGVMFDNYPRVLWIHAPSTAQVGEDFDITVEAWDAFERVSAIYKGRINFSVISYNLSTYEKFDTTIADLPEPYTFTGQLFGSDMAYGILDGKDNGIHHFSATINSTGIHYITVFDSVTKNSYYSNPVIVRNFTTQNSMIYWGDIHTHSHLSDGSGLPNEHFYYAENVARLDFNALTDHGEIMLFSPGSLDFLESSTNRFHKPNDFVTFHGIEWTNVDTGHYVCIFSGDQLLKNPVLSYMTVPTTEALWDALDDFTNQTNSKALALPHHTTKKSYIQDWTQINPKYVRIAEVTSVHGECLFEQRHELNYRGAIDPPPTYTHGSSVIDAFSMGFRMTMYSSSDEHDGHPGHSLSHTRAYIGHQRPYSLWHTRNEHPYPGGITAVFASNLTRESVFDSLYQGRIFSSADHGRPILMFDINNVGVGDGSTVTVSDETSPRNISVFLAQDGSPVALKSQSAIAHSNGIPNWNVSVEIIKNGALWKTIDISAPVANITISDTEPIEGVSFEEYCIERNGNFYINQYSNNPINPSTLNTQGFDYYLIRVIGDNGRTSYTGPIWVEY
ncbi:MAG: conserved membrane protein of unknown function [Promethearchaeota archaeon]|nr:MAG: conserved membrane protein of unknown function [Candidatus Lokiarchaeota archaeon]